MKFGHEYEQALANDDFPPEWLESAIDYKYLKKCIKKVRRELLEIGLDKSTLDHLSLENSGSQSEPNTTSTNQNGTSRPAHGPDYYSAVTPHLDSIPEEFAPQLRVLVDAETGMPLDATLAPETKTALQKLARHEMISKGRRELLGAHHPQETPRRDSAQTSPDDHAEDLVSSHDDPEAPPSRHASDTTQTRWVQIPLTSANRFYNLLEPKLEELEQLRDAETRNLEASIMDLGAAVENVVEPVREGFEARRRVSYRDLYFWREMFRLYLSKPIFYSATEQNRGALTYSEARARLEAYDQELRATGLLAKMQTPEAISAAQKFLDLNVDILRIMRFQEMNAQAMTKILKKFDKRTHVHGQVFLKQLRERYPTLVPFETGRSTANSTVDSNNSLAITRNTASTNDSNNKIRAGGFAQSIARDMYSEITSKVVSIVPQIDDWNCPVCLSMAWKPVNLGCCRSVFCIRCVIGLRDRKIKRCPCCNAETLSKVDVRNIDWDLIEFLEKYFPLEVKKRQKENELAMDVRQYGEDFVNKGNCTVM